MRLIDADKLIKVLAEYRLAMSPNNELDEEGSLMYRVIGDCIKKTEEQPTVFDADVIIDKVQKKSLKMSTAKPPHTYMRAIGTHDVEKIIREEVCKK